jgi:hypothetical protein
LLSSLITSLEDLFAELSYRINGNFSWFFVWKPFSGQYILYSTAASRGNISVNSSPIRIPGLWRWLNEIDFVLLSSNLDISGTTNKASTGMSLCHSFCEEFYRNQDEFYQVTFLPTARTLKTRSHVFWPV